LWREWPVFRRVFRDLNRDYLFKGYYFIKIYYRPIEGLFRKTVRELIDIRE
jgi:hypothetical protein